MKLTIEVEGNKITFQVYKSYYGKWFFLLEGLPGQCPLEPEMWGYFDSEMEATQRMHLVLEQVLCDYTGACHCIESDKTLLRLWERITPFKTQDLQVS